MIKGGTERRRPHVLVVGIAGLVALIAALMTALLFWALLLVWGYVRMGVALGVLTCAGLGGAILFRRRRDQRWSQDQDSRPAA